MALIGKCSNVSFYLFFYAEGMQDLLKKNALFCKGKGTGFHFLTHKLTHFHLMSLFHGGTVVQ